MKLLYFNGFSLQLESELFSEYLIKNDVSISGFSYGAIKAFEYVLNTDKRVDKLQLFSPAFFNDKSEKFKRMQIIYFKKNSDNYINNFLENCGFKKELLDKYLLKGTSQELHELLYYKWDEVKLESVVKKGIKIEVYLGGKDKIINSNEACEFFRKFGEVYYIKEANHLLMQSVHIDRCETTIYGM